MTLQNAFENLAVESKQDDIITVLGDLFTELTAKFESGQEVALDATTLAALESINSTISGTVALDATTLSALETINAVCSGTVALDAGTLSALENITATISGSVAVTGPLTDTQLRATPVPISDGSGSITVDGTVGVSGTVPVSGPLTDTQLRASAVPTYRLPPSVSAITSFVAAITSAVALASNANRRGFSIYNDSVSSTLYIAYAATASTSDFTLKIAPGGYFEGPDPCYTGVISGIWSGTVGSAKVTEVTV